MLLHDSGLTELSLVDHLLDLVLSGATVIRALHWAATSTMAYYVAGCYCWLLAKWLGSPPYTIFSWNRILKAWHLKSRMEHSKHTKARSFVSSKIQVGKLHSIVSPHSVGQSKSQDHPKFRERGIDATAYWKDWQRSYNSL